MDWIGWVATAAFAASYFFRDPAMLRRWQAGAALLWMAYGFAIHSSPVVVANVIVASLAIGSTWFRRTNPLEAATTPAAAAPARGSSAAEA